MILEYLKTGKRRAYRSGWNGIRNVMHDPVIPKTETEIKNPVLVSHTHDNVTEFNHDVIPKTFPPMFIYIEVGEVIPFEQLRDPIKKWLNPYPDDKNDMHVAPHFNLKTVDGTMEIGWRPSQEDILADDWVVLD